MSWWQWLIAGAAVVCGLWWLWLALRAETRWFD